MTLETIIENQSEKISQLTKLLSKFAGMKDITLPTKNFPKLKEGSLYQRKSDGRWEAQLRINGKQKSIACVKCPKEAYRRLKLAIQEKKNLKPEKPFTLFSWLEHWHQVYRLPKLKRGELAENTIISDITTMLKIKKTFKDIKLNYLTADYLQSGLNSMKQSRSREAVYFVLKMALGKARDRLKFNIMDLVDKGRHIRENGRALCNSEIERILAATRTQDEFDILMFYLYTGCRASELVGMKAGYVNLESNEIFIDGTKNALSKRTMPIFPQLKPILERRVKNNNANTKLFKYKYDQISWIVKRLRQEIGINFSLKDFRHTCSTNCKDSDIPLEVYHKWFGWSSERMARQVYNHETEKDKQTAQSWAKSFILH